VSARGEGAGDAERYAKVRERWDALTDKQRANRISWFREFHRVDQEMSDWDIIPPDLFCQCEHSWPCDPVVLLAANDRLERDLAAALAALVIAAGYIQARADLGDGGARPTLRMMAEARGEPGGEEGDEHASNR
jgi:hypothetical protein